MQETIMDGNTERPRLIYIDRNGFIKPKLALDSYDSDVHVIYIVANMASLMRQSQGKINQAIRSPSKATNLTKRIHAGAY